MTSFITVTLLAITSLGVVKLVNPGFAGGAATGSLVRASFSPDGRFVISGSERGYLRVWEAQEGRRVRTPLQVRVRKLGILSPVGRLRAKMAPSEVRHQNDPRLIWMHVTMAFLLLYALA